MRILLLTKAGDAHARSAAAYLRLHVEDVCVFELARSDAFPSLDSDPGWDYVVSYLCPRVVPRRVLDRAGVAAINFHPGPPEYPGIGCTNFALYDQVRTFGVTCHHMAPRVDTGAVIAVDRFPVLPTDSVASLTQRCYAHIAGLFYQIVDGILAGKPLPSSGEAWTRAPYKRSELDALCRITPEMPPDEIARRVRATSYPGYPGPFVELGGYRFVHEATRS